MSKTISIVLALAVGLVLGIPLGNRLMSAPEDAAQALIDGALARGGRDNVSAVVVEYDGPDGVSSIRAGGSAVLQWWPIAAGVLAALAFAVAWVWFQRR